MTDKSFETMYKATTNQSLGFIAKRFLLNRRGKLLGRHRLTIIGIALGIFALLSVSSVMNGFDKDMRQRIIGTRAEMRLSSKDVSPLADYEAIMDKLNSNKYIYATAPIVRNELVLVNGSDMAGTACFGIDLNKQIKLSPVLRPIDTKALEKSSTNWLQGLINAGIDESDFSQNGIILGTELAESIGARLGDEVKLISPLSKVPTPFGLMPKILSVKVVGIFIAGMPEYDRLYSYIDLKNGQFFSGYDNEIDNIQIKTTNERQLFKITAILQKFLPEYKIENWSSYDSSLYNAMSFEKYLMIVILGLMFIIASFSMSGNILRTIVQRRKSIGILKALGYSDKDLVTLFMRQGLFLSISGIAIGVILSLLILSIQIYFAVIRIPMGNLPALIIPVDIRLWDYLLIPLIAFAISFISVIVPSRSVVGIDPIKLIREIV